MKWAEASIYMIISFGLFMSHTFLFFEAILPQGNVYLTFAGVIGYALWAALSVTAIASVWPEKEMRRPRFGRR